MVSVCSTSDELVELVSRVGSYGDKLVDDVLSW